MCISLDFQRNGTDHMTHVTHARHGEPKNKLVQRGTLRGSLVSSGQSANQWQAGLQGTNGLNDKKK